MATNSREFDPYHKWLGIPAHEQPPNYYRLLSIELFESDTEVIENAYHTGMADLKAQEHGLHVGLVDKLSREVIEARDCLLKAKKKAAYDKSLGSRLKAKKDAVQESRRKYEQHVIGESVRRATAGMNAELDQLRSQLEQVAARERRALLKVKVLRREVKQLDNVHADEARILEDAEAAPAAEEPLEYEPSRSKRKLGRWIVGSAIALGLVGVFTGVAFLLGLGKASEDDFEMPNLLAHEEGLDEEAAASDADPKSSPFSDLISRTKLKANQDNDDTEVSSLTPEDENDPSPSVNPDDTPEFKFGSASRIVLEELADQTVVAGDELKFTAQVVGSGLDGAILRYYLEKAPLNATIGLGTGVFSWTPDDDDLAQQHEIEIRVEVAGYADLVDRQSFVVTVTQTKPVAEPEEDPNLLTLTGHASPVRSVAFSPDGRRIVSGSLDHTAKVWQVENGENELTLKGHTDDVTCVIFSHDGRQIISGSHDDTLRVWNATSGATEQLIQGPNYGIGSLTLSPDGQLITTVDEYNYVNVWNIKTGFKAPNSYSTRNASSIAMSLDGQHVAIGGEYGTVSIYDAPNKRRPYSIKAHASEVSSVAFGPDGTWIVTASAYDQAARIWDTFTGNELRALNGHTHEVTSVAVSPDGRWIVSGSEDNTVRLWEAETGKEMLKLEGHSNIVRSVAFSPLSTCLASGGDDNKVKIRKLPNEFAVRPEPAEKKDLLGTKWSIEHLTMPSKKETIQFLTNSQIRLFGRTIKPSTGEHTWEPVTDYGVVRFQMHRNSVTLQGKWIEDDTMEGSARDKNGATWTWRATLISPRR